MNQALAQTVAYVERARAYMPAGTVPPFVLRFDAGSVPVGDLILTSHSRNVGELDDLALNRVRPLFATLPGVSAPPPFGGSPRTIVIHVDPERLHSYRMSTDEVVKALLSGNVVLPAGSIRTGSLNRITPVNSVVTDIRQFADLPVRVGAGPTVFIRDIGTVEDSNDVTLGYALVNGRRAVYLPVTKHADASTLDVIREVKESLPKIREVLPKDVIDRAGLRSVGIRDPLARIADSRGTARRGAYRADGAAVSERLAQRSHHRRDHSVRACSALWSDCGRPGRPSTS